MNNAVFWTLHAESMASCRGVKFFSLFIFSLLLSISRVQVCIPFVFLPECNQPFEKKVTCAFYSSFLFHRGFFVLLQLHVGCVHMLRENLAFVNRHVVEWRRILGR